ncbi:hypothetical protein [Nocardia miyunensis]|uniref:hypothetical protein n=1 Tax=Nocardia miyunensis TaxID=282684 RepID=UPI00082FC56B|nr:hypothetical protein [Nocardia miyunensis]
MLACLAAVLTVCTALVDLRARSRPLGHLVAATAVAQTGLVVVILTCMNRKLEDIRATGVSARIGIWVPKPGY